MTANTIKPRRRTGAVTCENCQYFKEQNRDRSGLCLIVDHKVLPAWVERSACLVGHYETCDMGLPKAPLTAAVPAPLVSPQELAALSLPAAPRPFIL